MDMRLTIAAALLAALAWTPARAAPAAQGEDLAKTCARVTNDDTIRSFTTAQLDGAPALRERTREAYKTLFPDAKGDQDASGVEAAGPPQYRCMDGKVLVCFVGANLPCVKMNANRRNAGAEAECRQDPKSEAPVSAAAAGHDAAYSFKCHGGHAEVTGEPWKLDKRGFAKKLWAALPDR